MPDYAYSDSHFVTLLAVTSHKDILNVSGFPCHTSTRHFIPCFAYTTTNPGFSGLIFWLFTPSTADNFCRCHHSFLLLICFSCCVSYFQFCNICSTFRFPTSAFVFSALVVLTLSCLLSFVTFRPTGLFSRQSQLLLQAG